MEWPQITMIALIALGLGVTLAKHGNPREPHDFFHQIIATAITTWLLIAGGFFN